jgi:hypothetical protein
MQIAHCYGIITGFTIKGIRQSGVKMPVGLEKGRQVQEMLKEKLTYVLLCL